jgi:nitrogen regulatory protein P-II 1
LYGPDDEADAVIRAIQERAFTGEIGDGRICVQHVEEAVRIRTGERDLDAV